jgi:hypothetical protein
MADLITVTARDLMGQEQTLYAQRPLAPSMGAGERALVDDWNYAVGRIQDIQDCCREGRWQSPRSFAAMMRTLHELIAETRKLSRYLGDETLVIVPQILEHGDAVQGYRSVLPSDTPYHVRFRVLVHGMDYDGVMRYATIDGEVMTEKQVDAWIARVVREEIKEHRAGEKARREAAREARA